MKTIVALSCHVNNWGAEKSFCAVIRSLSQNGYRVVVLLSTHGEIENTLKKYKIEYYIAPLVGGVLVGENSKGYIWKIRRLIIHIRKLIKSTILLELFLKNHGIKPDIIYTNTIVPSTGIYLSFRYRIPHIIHIREITDDDFPVLYYIGKRLYLKLLRMSLTYAICISKAVKDKFDPLLGFKCRLIYNGVLPKQLYKTNYSSVEEKKHIVFVGRLSIEKGILSILEATKLLVYEGRQDFVVDIWGNGVDENLIKTYLEQNDLFSYIALHGYGNDIPLIQYDLAIMSSPHEAFGRTTVEYMMAGLPVIGHNGGATPELIVDGVSGLLYNNIDELKKSIGLLLDDETLRESLGSNARRRAMTLFTEDRYLTEVCDLFKSI